MTDKEHFDKMDELIKETHDIADVIVATAKKTKDLYNTTDSRLFKDLYLELNRGLCNAGRAIADSGIKVTGLEIKVLHEAFAQKIGEVTG